MKGSCFCGAVAYQIDQLDGAIVHCHCLSCRKSHAAAFASTARVSRENFQWLRGQSLLSSFESSPGKQRHFCSVCGSHLVAERAAQSHVIVRVATLDDDPGLIPKFHIWRSHDVAWLQDDDETESFGQWQPDR